MMETETPRSTSPLVTLVDRLTQNGDAAPALLVQVDSDWAAVALKPSGLLTVLLDASAFSTRAAPESWGHILARASRVAHSETPEVLDGLFPGVMVVVLVGSDLGPEELAQAPAVLPALEREVRWMALGSRGLVRDLREGSRAPIAEAFKDIDKLMFAALKIATLEDAPPPDSRHRADTERAGEAALAAEGRFRRSVTRQWPPITTGLLAACALVFALQYAWGAVGAASGLLRMGALSGRQVLEGRPELLLSYALLHGGVVHIAMNGLALLALGRLLENVLGGSRTLMVFVLSALGGGIAATLFKPDQLVVGASGGIFGLMGALYGLTLHRGGALPDLARQRLRKALTQTLLLNVFISFLPGISLLGHAGGGLVGFALGVSGLASVGAPIPWLPPPAPEKLAQRNGINALIGVLSGSALVLSLSIALVRGTPWDRGLGAPREVALGNTGWVIDVPSRLKILESQKDDGSRAINAGDLRNDGLAVEAVIGPTNPRSDLAPDDREILSLWEKARASADADEKEMPKATPMSLHGIAASTQRGKIHGIDVVRWTLVPERARVVEVTVAHAPGTAAELKAVLDAVEPHPKK